MATYNSRNMELAPIDIEAESLNFPKLNFPSSFTMQDPSIQRANIGDAMQMRIQTPEQDLVSASRENTASIDKQTKAVTAQTKEIKDQYEKDLIAKKGTTLALAAAKFGISLFNAQSKYDEVVGAARFNIMQSRNQASDVLYRGRQAAFTRQSEGFKAGEQALLAMAAQGQSVTGAAVQKIQGSYEVIGAHNAMIEESNAIREALGFQLEEIGMEYQMDVAKSQRDMSMISSGLEFAANAYGAGVL